MRRAMPFLVVLLALQLGLAALLAVRKNPLASTTPQTPLIGTPLDQVDRILIEAHPATGATSNVTRVELTKRDGQWILPAYFNAPVDKFKLSSLLSEVASLKRGLPIATSATALERFKIADDDFERRLTLSQGRKALGALYFGSSAGVHKSDARTAGDRAVYNVDLATYELPTDSADWLDGDVLQRDPASVTELDVTSGAAQAPLQLVRTTAAPANAKTPAAAPQWLDPGLPAGRQIDAARADSLAREVAELHVEAVLGVSPKPEWQQDHPLLTLRIRDDKHPTQLVTWTLSQPPSLSTQPARSKATTGAATPEAPQPRADAADSYYVLKASAQPWYFRISSVSGKQLLDDSSAQALIAAAAAPRKGAHDSTTAGTAARPRTRRSNSPAQ